MKKNLNQKIISLVEYYNLLNINMLLNKTPINRTNKVSQSNFKGTK